MMLMMSLANFLSQSKNKIKRTDRVHRFRILFITRSDYNSFTHNDNESQHSSGITNIRKEIILLFA